MRHVSPLRVLIAGLLLLAFARPAAGQVDYVVRGGSTFEEGCYDPCQCPILGLYLGGTFLVTSTGVDDEGFASFAIEGIDWVAFSAQPVRRISGGGTLRVGRKVQQLRLELQLDGDPAQIFDSGLVPTRVDLPAIDVEVSVGNRVCFDTVIALRAAPLRPGVIELAAPHRWLWHWTVQPGAADYDVVHGDLDWLRRSGGDFTTATEDCLADDLLVTALEQELFVDDGRGLWLAVRGLPAAGYDSGGPSQAAPRDGAIDAAPLACLP